MYLKTRDHSQAAASRVNERLGLGQFASPCSCCSGRLGLEGIGFLNASNDDCVRSFTVGNFSYTSHSLNNSQKNLIASIARDIVGGVGRVPPLKRLKEVRIIGYSSGTRNLESHATKRAVAVFEELKKQLEGLDATVEDIAKIAFGDPVTQQVASQAQSDPSFRKVMICLTVVKHPDPKRRPSTWKLSADEERNIRNHYGEDILDWIKIPPNGIEVKEFTPPHNLRDNYKTVFVWKSDDARKGCGPFNKKRVHILALLRDDKPYWDERTGGKRVASEALRTAQATVIRDYRKLILERKLCPPSAFNTLVKINRDVIYVAIVGLFGFMARFVTGARTGHHLPKPEVLARAIATFVKLHF
jgi:hypothetical protein